MCSVCRESSELVKGFLRATAKGFHFATEHPEEAAKLFFDQASQHLQGAGPSAELQWEQVKALSALCVKGMSPGLDQFKQLVCSKWSLYSMMEVMYFLHDT